MKGRICEAAAGVLLVAYAVLLFVTWVIVNVQQIAPLPQSEAEDAYRSRAEESRTIEEDDPRWDCARDGNRVCGPGQEPGGPGLRFVPTITLDPTQIEDRR